MWNPEARDSSSIILTFMSSWERPKIDAAAAREEGDKKSLWKRAAAGLDELELELWVSLWSNHSGEESTPPLAWLDGGEQQDAAAAPPGRRREARGTRATKSTAAEELASVLGEVAEKS